jgi:hypothetical protein
MNGEISLKCHILIGRKKEKSNICPTLIFTEKEKPFVK